MGNNGSVNGSGKSLAQKVKIFATLYSSEQLDKPEHSPVNRNLLFGIENLMLILSETSMRGYVIGYSREGENKDFQPAEIGFSKEKEIHPVMLLDKGTKLYNSFVEWHNGLKEDIKKALRGEINNLYGISNGVILDRKAYEQAINACKTYFNMVEKAPRLVQSWKAKALSEAKERFNPETIDLVQNVNSQIEKLRVRAILGSPRILSQLNPEQTGILYGELRNPGQPTSYK